MEGEEVDRNEGCPECSASRCEAAGESLGAVPGCYIMLLERGFATPISAGRGKRRVGGREVLMESEPLVRG